MFGMIFVLTQYLQLVLGYSPLEAGIRILPWAVMYMVAAPRSARLVERFGYRAVVSSGLSIVAAGLSLLAFSGIHADYPLLALSLVVTAAGMGMVTAPSTGAIIVSLPLNKAGVGSAVNDTTRELGGALGVAVIGSVLASIYQSGLPVTAGAARESLGAALQQAPEFADVARHAYVHAFDLTMLLAVGVALLASVAVSWVLRPRRQMMPRRPSRSKRRSHRVRWRWLANRNLHVTTEELWRRRRGMHDVRASQPTDGLETSTHRVGAGMHLVF